MGHPKICTFKIFFARLTYDKTDEVDKNGKIELNLYLELKNQDREIHTESFIHTWPMFFYEFGGTVGFLLGYSVLSFFDKMVDFITSLSK